MAPSLMKAAGVRRLSLHPPKRGFGLTSRAGRMAPMSPSGGSAVGTPAASPLGQGRKGKGRSSVQVSPESSQNIANAVKGDDPGDAFARLLGGGGWGK